MSGQRLSRFRAALVVVVGLAVVGAGIGALWMLIAPPAHGVVALTKAGDRVQVYLGSEADNFFIAAFLLLGLTGVFAVVAAVLVWQWRTHRGPVMVGAVTIGLLAATAIAVRVGSALVGQRYSPVDVATAPVTPDDRVFYYTQGTSAFFGNTPLQMAATLLAPAGIGALVYALMAVSTARDDLGAWPPIDPPVYPVSPDVRAIPEPDPAQASN